MLAPDGRPVPGAKLYRTPAIDYHSQLYVAHEYATTGPDGRFRFLADRRAQLTLAYQTSLYERTVVAAAAPNFGVAWVEVPPGGRNEDLTLQLVDDQPITGQIVDLEGKPVPGVTLQVMEIRAAAGEDPGPWLEAAKAKKGLSDQLEQQYLSRVTIAPALKFTADAEGRFRLTGIGRNRLVMALLDGPTIISERLKILTRPGETFKVQRYVRRPGATTTYYGATFRACGSRRPSRSSAWSATRTRRSRWPGSRSVPSRPTWFQGNRPDHDRRPGPLPTGGYAQGQGKQYHGRPEQRPTVRRLAQGRAR